MRLHPVLVAICILNVVSDEAVGHVGTELENRTELNLADRLFATWYNTTQGVDLAFGRIQLLSYSR